MISAKGGGWKAKLLGGTHQLLLSGNAKNAEKKKTAKNAEKLREPANPKDANDKRERLDDDSYEGVETQRLRAAPVSTAQ